MAKTKIEWTQGDDGTPGRTWNFLRGCSLVSAGCQHCYAMLMAHRFNYQGGAYEGLTEMGPAGPRWNGKVRVVDDKLDEPLRVKKPQKWFVNSMSDLFHEDVPEETIEEAFAVMALADKHTFQILTKRPHRMREILTGEFFWAMVEGRAQRRYHERTGEDPSMWVAVHGPLPNVWLGVSAEDQKRADERIPPLLETAAAVRFVSYEPALGPIDFVGLSEDENYLDRGSVWTSAGWRANPSLDWIIVGGESGPGARPFNMEWAKDVVRQCGQADVACFVKQMGSKAIFGADTLAGPFEFNKSDSKGGKLEEFPEELRVRQFPKGVA